MTEWASADANVDITIFSSFAKSRNIRQDIRMLAFSFILPAKSFDGEVALDWSSGTCVAHSKKAQPTNE